MPVKNRFAELHEEITEWRHDLHANPEILFEKWNSEIDLMLSDGYGRNIPSTVIDLTKMPYEIVRKGAGDVPKNLLISL